MIFQLFNKSASGLSAVSVVFIVDFATADSSLPLKGFLAGLAC